MLVTKDTQLKSIQNEFSSLLPGLSLKFYKSNHDKFHSNHQYDEIVSNFTIIDLNPDFDKDIEVEFWEDEVVFEFERRIAELLGVNVQVLRRSKKVWLQTSVTDSWTLKKEMEHAI